MLDNYWKQFKSGTDIRGVAVDGVEGQPLNLTDEAIEKMASAFALWLAEKRGKDVAKLKISVGHDSRISAGRISAAVIRSLYAAGVNVIECGLASTPAMFMSTLGLECDGAVQITASHHPFNRNGLKFFTPDGGLGGDDITAILEKCQNGDVCAPAEGKHEWVDFMAQYAADLRELIKKEANAGDFEHPLAGFKIVVDAGNGAGG
ncbi:MAG: phosphomannomutase/phosphoglucomutase, partial [Clostridia bacterium]|nr:phosphomannomutase/phosphoglucomutase [Clostridia bacterium]